MTGESKLTAGEAVRRLRDDPSNTELVRDCYLDADVQAAAERFRQSAEFAEVCRFLNNHLRDGKILDLGAGTGIASYALARAGAKVVYALEPDPCEDVGRGAIQRLSEGLSIELLDSFGEEIPLEDGAVDAIYARQVLHHTQDLNGVLRECARVLRSGGLLLSCREHVVDDEAQLKQFLEEHPLHHLTGGEHAYALDVYQQAITSAGLKLQRVMDPWDSIINAFPTVRSTEELAHFPETVLHERFGAMGRWLALLPGMRSLAWRRIKGHAVPGRFYSFLAVKP